MILISVRPFCTGTLQMECGGTPGLAMDGKYFIFITLEKSTHSFILKSHSAIYLIFVVSEKIN